GRAAAIAPLTAGQAAPLLAEAVARWRAAGADVSVLANTRIAIADLTGRQLGLAAGHTIWLDADAAGWGWFVDPTPGRAREFVLSGDQGEQNRMDLLTVLMHELGHVLGHDHDEGGVMGETLAAGARVTPGPVGPDADSGAALKWDLVSLVGSLGGESARKRG